MYYVGFIGVALFCVVVSGREVCSATEQQKTITLRADSPAKKICFVAAYDMNSKVYLVKNTGGLYQYNSHLPNKRIKDLAIIKEIVEALVRNDLRAHLGLIHNKLVAKKAKLKKKEEQDFCERIIQSIQPFLPAHDRQDVLPTPVVAASPLPPDKLIEPGSKSKKSPEKKASEQTEEQRKIEQPRPSDEIEVPFSSVEEQLDFRPDKLVLCHQIQSSGEGHDGGIEEATAFRYSFSRMQVIGGGAFVVVSALCIDAFARKECSVLARGILKGKRWAHAIGQWLSGKEKEVPVLRDEESTEIIDALEHVQK